MKNLDLNFKMWIIFFSCIYEHIIEILFFIGSKLETQMQFWKLFLFLLKIRTVAFTQWKFNWSLHSFEIDTFVIFWHQKCLWKCVNLLGIQLLVWMCQFIFYSCRHIIFISLYLVAIQILFQNFLYCNLCR